MQATLCMIIRRSETFWISITKSLSFRSAKPSVLVFCDAKQDRSWATNIFSKWLNDILPTWGLGWFLCRCYFLFTCNFAFTSLSAYYTDRTLFKSNVTYILLRLVHFGKGYILQLRRCCYLIFCLNNGSCVSKWFPNVVFWHVYWKHTSFIFPVSI